MFDDKQAEVMREQAGLRRRFQRTETPQIQFNVQDDEGNHLEGPGMPQKPATSQAPAPQAPEFPTPPSFAQENHEAAEDTRIFPGGPYLSQVQSWKKQFGEIYIAEINDELYIFRPLNRYEYKQIMATPNLDPLQREEIIVEICTLYPTAFTFEEMSSGKAGIPAVLAEQILEKSGFNRNVSVRAL
jgi:hypothetical protein